MKIFKRILQALLILVLIGLIFRGWIFRHSFTYKEVGDRITYIATDEELINYIEESVGVEDNPEIVKDLVELISSARTESEIYKFESRTIIK